MASVNGAIDHKSHQHQGTKAERELCPLCGSPIKTAATRQQIEERLRSRLATAEKALLTQFTKEHRQAMATAAAEIARAKKEAAAKVEKARRETASREASIRREAIQ